MVGGQDSNAVDSFVVNKEAIAGGDMSSIEAAIETLKHHDRDVGSSEVQVAILTARLAQLAAHSQANPNDEHSRRGMMVVISKRKQLLQYLKETNLDSYRKTIAALGLRK